MPAPALAPPARSAFFDALRAADLLTAAQFARAQALAGPGAAAAAAGALVAAGLLTRFQADRLLTGRTDGFQLGPYVILEQIGRGAQSRVYRAKHRTMHRPVAVKVLSAALTDTPEQREAFRAAARAAGQLAHPNIVTAYDADEFNGRFYLVAELVDGPDLGALGRARGPLPVAEACEYVRQIATGLQHAHEKGMVHRALKPTNLLVAWPSPAAPLTVKIADFGLPKASAKGDFAAPELNGEHDYRADLYSLGRVFQFLLTGRTDRTVLPLGQLRRDVPPEVAAIVQRLLAPNPADRFASAAELLLHLAAACAPVVIPVDAYVNLGLPAYPAYPGQDSGYLTGRHPKPAPTVPALWARLTDESETGNTIPLSPDDTPPPRPRKATPNLPGHGARVPLWMTATFFVGAVLLCLMGINAVVKALAQ